MSDCTLIALIRLRSPFTGESWPVPPDVPQDFVAELERRGFTRIEEPVKAKSKTRVAEDSHG